MQAIGLKLGMMLILYTMCLTIIVFLDLLNTRPVNDSNSYTPKSKRYKIWAMISPMTTWFQKRADELHDKVSRWNTNRRVRIRIKRLHQIAQRIQQPRQDKGQKWIAMMAHATLIMQAQGSNPRYDNEIRFDTDSGKFGIDNRCTACISDRVEDFEGTLVELNRVIKEFG